MVRAAASEIEQYQRVPVPDADGIDLDGQYAPELVHLFAELLENAVRFSSPDTDVRVNASLTSDGCTVAVADQGIGMGPDELEEANRRLTGEVELHEANYLGHFVIGRLARRLGATVRLETREAGGLRPWSSCPTELLTGDDVNDPPGAVVADPRAGRTGRAEAPARPTTTAGRRQPVGAATRPTGQVPAEPVHRDAAGRTPPPSRLAEALPRYRPALTAPCGRCRPPPPPRAAPAVGALTAQSFGLRKRQSGTSLAKTQRAGAGRNDAGKGRGRNAESVRDRFSAFAAGRQQAQTDPDAGSDATPTSRATNEETH